MIAPERRLTQRSLVGVTTPNTLLRVEGTDVETISDAAGNFSLAGVPVTLGDNQLAVIASDDAGKEAFWLRYKNFGETAEAYCAES